MEFEHSSEQTYPPKSRKYRVRRRKLKKGRVEMVEPERLQRKQSNLFYDSMLGDEDDVIRFRGSSQFAKFIADGLGHPKQDPDYD
jgi:hypothetical protein